MYFDTYQEALAYARHERCSSLVRTGVERVRCKRVTMLRWCRKTGELVPWSGWCVWLQFVGKPL
jgi:hypothetical protein